MNELISKQPSEIQELTNKLINQSNMVLGISTRAANVNTTELVNFNTFDDTKLATIMDKMPEIDRATKAFGKQNSQTTSKMMSLTMLNTGVYHRLRQCLAQIEAKRNALRDNTFKIQRSAIRIKDLEIDIADISRDLEKMDKNSKNYKKTQCKLNEYRVDLAETIAGLVDCREYYEAAIKEIAIYQEAYEEIKKNYNIPDNWDELDFERAEVEAHVKTAFQMGIRDVLMTGHLNMGTMEYLEQFGINPIAAIYFIEMYVKNNMNNVHANKGNRIPDIRVLYEFLNQMYEIFGKEYEIALQHNGIDTFISKWCIYVDPKRDRTDEDQM